MRALSKIVIGAGLVLLSSIPMALAQEVPEAEVTVSPDDRIVWEPTGVHGLRFGGTTEVEGTEVQLTDWDTVQTMLDFGEAVPDTTTEPEQAQFAAATTVTATVRANADDAVAPSFVFTCIFDPHADQMTTVTFKIVPRADGEEPRTVTIGTPQGIAWWIKKDGGNIRITPRPAVPGA